ncbi:MAG TPA: hypothetical protein VFT19_07275 [Solirubrobacterales bacterium]|nr:hypothetical protein [Solirubrobacterales bacterium]
MTCHLRPVGLAVIATLAICAYAGPPAQAEPGEPGIFTSGETEGKPEHITSILQGTQFGEAAENYFQIEGAEGGSVTCTNAGVSLTSTIAEGEATTLTVQPSYEECTAFGGMPAVVEMNECDYTFTQPHTIGSEKYTGDAILYCPLEQSITVRIYLEGTLHAPETYSIPLCDFAFSPKEGKEQTLGGHIVYTNHKNGTEPTTGEKFDEFTTAATLTEVHWAKTGLCGEAEGNDGVFKGNATFVGMDADGCNIHHDVWIGDETSP